jgi:hypothetical protein
MMSCRLNTHSFLPGLKAQKDAEAGRANLEDISDDSDSYDNSSVDSNNDDSDNDSDNDDSEDFEEEDNNSDSMSTPGKKKKTPKKSKSPVPSVADVTMKVSSSKPYSMNYKFPYIMTTYKEEDDEMIDIDFFVPSFPKDHFIPDIVDKGNELELRTQIPKFFPDANRVMKSNQGDGFNQNTYKAQAWKDIVSQIDDDFNFAKIIIAEPMSVRLPFRVEERIVSWEVQAYANKNEWITDNLGSPQFHFTLNVKLMKLKSKRRTVGGFRIVDAGDDGADDESML